jgi:hypothetical protein
LSRRLRILATESMSEWRDSSRVFSSMIRRLHLRFEGTQSSRGTSLRTSSKIHVCSVASSAEILRE